MYATTPRFMPYHISIPERQLVFWPFCWPTSAIGVLLWAERFGGKVCLVVVLAELGAAAGAGI